MSTLREAAQNIMYIDSPIPVASLAQKLNLSCPISLRRLIMRGSMDKPIYNKWVELGGEYCHLGDVITETLSASDGKGRYNHFQNGSIFWTQDTGAHEMRKEIMKRWVHIGGEKSQLGYPITDQMSTPTGICQYNHFQRGSIFFSLGRSGHHGTESRETLNNIRLHFKILFEPCDFSIDHMVDSMQQVYADASIRIDTITKEYLNLDHSKDHLLDIDVADCLEKITEEQKSLFSYNSNVNKGDIVIYFVRSVELEESDVFGCANYPEGQPGAIIAETATEWTLAHEICHILGYNPPIYKHTGNTNNLMYSSTYDITNPPPELNSIQIEVMLKSDLVYRC